MLRSMSDAVSGLEAHQKWLDVIGNNIANVDTPGFKSSDVNFAAVFAQTLSAGSAPALGLGGTDPQQVGLGVGIGSITQKQSQGALQQTGSPTNLAIQGDGYFVLDMGPQGTGYSRVGDFSFDSAGDLVSQSTGFKVMGWMPNANGTMPAENATTMQDIVIPQNVIHAPVATTAADFGGNLDATLAGTTQTVSLPVTVYDALGNPVTLTFTFTPPTAAGSSTWSWSASLTNPPAGETLNGSTTGTATGTVVFSSSGAYASMTGGPITLGTATGATTSIAPDFTALTQFASATSAQATGQNGAAAGTLQSLSVDSRGLITGHFTNGLTETLGQVALATFANPQGLVQQGQDVYVTGPNSGLPLVAVAGTGAAGTIASGSLEGSNVDLASQFTQMIAAERGFQANAQVVTTANTILQTLVQLGQ
jgi:flagellar hook protein FlgE